MKEIKENKLIFINGNILGSSAILKFTDMSL